MIDYKLEETYITITFIIRIIKILWGHQTQFNFASSTFLRAGIIRVTYDMYKDHTENMCLIRD